MKKRIVSLLLVLVLCLSLLPTAAFAEELPPEELPSEYNVTYHPDSDTTEADTYTDKKTPGQDLTLRGETYHRSDYVQVGWQKGVPDDDGTITYSTQYDLGDTYETDEDLHLYPVWEKLVTVTVPFTIEVKKGGSVTPPSESFTLEPLGSESSGSSIRVTITGNTVETNGAGTYTGMLTFESAFSDINTILSKAIIRQETGTSPGWTYDDQVWCVSLDGGDFDENGQFTPFEGSSDASTYSVGGEPTASATIPLKISKAEKVEIDDGIFEYNPGSEFVDALSFTNTYTAYTVSFNANGGTGTMNPVTVTSNSYTLPDCGFTAPTNKKFKGWAESATGDVITAKTIDVTGDKTLYAIWEDKEDTPTPPAATYTVTVQYDDAQGTASATPNTDVTEGTKVELSATPNSGYKFKEWQVVSGSVTITGSSFTMPASNVTVKAIFEKDDTPTPPAATYTVTVEFDSTKGTASATPNTNVAEGTKVELSATPKSGYKFKEWQVVSGSVTITDGNFTMPASNVTVRAIFEPERGPRPKPPFHISKPKPSTKKDPFTPNGLNAKDHIAYVQGYEDGTVRPNAPITRAETAMMLYRLLTDARRDEIETRRHRFTDISTDAWYRTAVATMSRGGYITGYTDGTFGGDNSITRAEFVAMLVRFIGVQDAKCSFTDVSRSHWAYDYIATAASAGWITGDDTGAFRPDDPITRAEAMAIINRVLNRGVDEDSKLLNFKKWPDNNSSAWYYYDVIEATNGHDYIGSRPSEDWTALHK